MVTHISAGSCLTLFCSTDQFLQATSQTRRQSCCATSGSESASQCVTHCSHLMTSTCRIRLGGPNLEARQPPHVLRLCRDRCSPSYTWALWSHRSCSLIQTRSVFWSLEKLEAKQVIELGGLRQSRRVSRKWTVPKPHISGPRRRGGLSFGDTDTDGPRTLKNRSGRSRVATSAA
ncbi:uncharacterized protein HD556DRAFT_848634 [Suillus plorans]|uniref:Uncharacterized protein n=1 Tax=Suillus plorans TaxID=116603 RepID=A0A9P7DCM6_9AGAM|nr:uncharacterized protein HD556DRAFT_848634 [Suillus plorans]KAG1788662.1 hypothetical protein HD556DRAFT_848634 [Suillus plorans]